MTVLVGFLQRASRRDGRGVTVTKERRRRLAAKLNGAMPYVLDGIGAMLLSGSVMMLSVVAGVAALGLSVFYMNHRVYGGH
jgi:hypothetical protein